MNVYQFKLSFELPVQILVQLLLELKVILLDQNVNELEFELSRVEMKLPISGMNSTEN